MKSEHLAEAKRKWRSRSLPTIINYKDAITFNNKNEGNNAEGNKNKGYKILSASAISYSLGATAPPHLALMASAVG